MVFSSPLFLFMFLPVTLLLHGLVAPRFKNAALALCSLVFYAWGEPIGILVMLLSIGINYSLGMLLEKNENRTVRKLFLAAAVVSNLAILFYFKYFEFAVGTLNQWFSLGLPQKHVALPIGISFFTFQIMSYVVDVYRKEVNAQRSVIDLTMYISLFPQLIAGPIVRYIDVEKQIRERHVDFGGFSNGVLRFMKGFSKKILLADQMAPLADAAFSNIGSSLYLSWFGIVAYALQIYFDFSGYSDMAIGLGKMLGFEFAENFNFPYISRSVREFWRRWHISLSTWFRDYVYM